MVLDDMDPIHKVFQSIHLGIGMLLIFPLFDRHLHSCKHKMELDPDQYRDKSLEIPAYHYSNLTRVF